MSQVIDSSVVELSLDNSNFERNVKKSIDMLDKFKVAVASASQFTVKAGTEMAESIGSFAKAGVDRKLTEQMEALETAAKNVSSQFTVWGQVIQDIRSRLAKLVSKELTLIPRKLTQTAKLITGLVKSGGLSRALNLERAQFQMKGLGVSWEKALTDFNYAVQDTAYGLDSAARAASQLSASGVKLGDDMKAALRGISGVAAMTNSSYDEIAYVFNAVAGMGRVTAQQLNRLSIRGINAFATIAKYLHKTQAEVRDMVSKGEIDFDTFAKAMDSAFGEHAKDANKTFEGALSNVKAALSRIGAEIATPYYNTARDILNNLRLFLKSLKDSLDPSLKAIGGTITIVGQQIIKFIDTFKEVDEHAFDGFENFVKRINAYLKSDAFKAVRTTIVQIFTDVGNVVKWITKWVGEVVFLVKPAFDQAAGFAGAFLSTVSRTVHNVLSSIVRLVMSLTPIIEPVVWGISDAFGIVGRTVEIMRNNLLSMGMTIRGLADPIAEVIKPLAGPLYKTFVTIGQVISNIIGHLVDVFESLLPLITPVLKVLSGQFKIWLLGIERFWNYVSLIVTAVSDNLAPVVISAGRFLSRIGDLVWKIAGGIESLFIAVWKAVFGPLEGGIETASKGLTIVFDKLTNGIFAVEPVLKKIAQNVAYTLGYTVGTLKNIFGAAEPLGTYLENLFDWLIKALESAFSLVGMIAQGLTYIFTGKFVGTAKEGGWIVTFVEVSKKALSGLFHWLTDWVGPFLTSIVVTVFGTLGLMVGGIYDSIKSIASFDFAELGKTIWGAITAPFTGHTVSASTLYDEETMKMIESSGYDTQLLMENTIKETGEATQETAEKVNQQTQQQVQNTTNGSLNGFFEWVKNTAIPFMVTKAGELMNFLGENLTKEGVDKFVETLGTLSPVIRGVLVTWGMTHRFKPFKSFAKPIDSLAKSIGNIFKPLEELGKSLKDAKLDVKITTGLEETFKQLVKLGKNINKNYKANTFASYAKSFLLIASSIGVLSASLIGLTKFADINKIYDIAPIMTVMIGGIALLAKTIGGINFTKTTYQMSALDKLVPSIKSVFTSLKQTFQTFKVNSFMVAFAASVGVLSASILKFKKIGWDDAIKAAVMYGSFLGEIVLAQRLLKSFGGDALGKFSSSFSISVGLLGTSIKSFRKIDWYDAVNAMEIFGAFLLELVGYQALIKKFKIDHLKSFSVGFAASVPLLALGVRTFKGIEFTDALPMLAVSGTFFTELAMISAAINSHKATFMNTIYTLLTMGEMFVIMEGLAVTISLMTLLDQDKLMKVAAPLALVGSVFAAMEVGSLALRQAKITSILLMITALGEVMYGLYYLTTSLDDLQVEKLDVIANAITKLIGIGSLATLLFALAGSFGFVPLLLGTLFFFISTAIIGGVGYLLGWLEDNEGSLSKALNTGLPMVAMVFEQVGEMYGALGGGVFSKFAEGVGSGIGGAKGNYVKSEFEALQGILSVAGDDLSKFSNVVNTDITDTTIDRLSRFADALTKLATTGESTSRFDNLHSGITLMTTDLPAFGSAAESLTDDQKKAIEDTAKVIEQLGGAITSIPKTSALGDIFTGIHDVQKFGEDLGYLASGLMSYYVGLTYKDGKPVGIDTTLITNSANAAKALAELENSLPNTGGILQEYIGQPDLQLFGSQLGMLGRGLASYQMAWGDTSVNTDLIKNSATAAQSIARLYTLLPKTGGKFQNIFGTQNLWTFGSQLTGFGTGFMGFVRAIEGFTPSETIERVASIATVYAGIENSLPQTGSVLHKLIFGEKNLETFGSRLVGYATYLQSYQTEIEKVDFDKLAGGTNFLDSIVTAFTKDPDPNIGFTLVETLSNVIMNLASAVEDEDNKAALQNVGTSILTEMLSGFSTDEAKLTAKEKLEALLKLLSDTVPYTTVLETEKFGEKLFAKIVSAVNKALATNVTLASLADSILKKIGEGFDTLVDTYSTIGNNIADGLAGGMTSLAAKATVLKAGIGLGKVAILGIKKGSDTHSPSKAAYEVGGFIVEGLDLGFTDGSDLVFSSARSLGETAIAGLNEGVQNGVKKEDPFGYLQSMIGGDDNLLSLAMISTMKTDKDNYKDFAEALLGLKYGNFYENYEKLAKLYGSNPLKMTKVIYDQLYAKWDDKQMGERKHRDWRVLYDDIMGGGIGADTILSALMTKFGVEFETPSYLLEDFNALFDDTDSKVNTLVDDINVGLIKTLGELQRKYKGLHDTVNLDFNKVAEEVQQAQIDYLAMQNDSNASKEDLNLAYRRLTILQGSLSSLDKQHEYLDKQHEQEKRLAELEAENARKEVQQNSSRRNSVDALGFSASDTGSKLDDLSDSLDDAADGMGDLDDAAEEALDGLTDFKDDFARSGYDLATAFQDDGWWKSFLDGSESGLAGYDLGSILAGNTISGLDGAANLFGDEGWDLGKYFEEGMKNALFGDDQNGILGIFNRLKTEAENGTLTFKSVIQEGINGILEWLGLKAVGVEFNFDDFVSLLKTKAGEFIDWIGTQFEGLAGNIASFLESFSIDTSALRQAWTNFTSGNGSIGGVVSGALSMFGFNTSPLPDDNTIVIDPNANKQTAAPSNPNIVYDIDPDVIVIDPDKVKPVGTITNNGSSLWNTAVRSTADLARSLYDNTLGLLVSPNKKTADAANNATNSFNNYSGVSAAAKSAPVLKSNNDDVVVAINDLNRNVQALRTEVKDSNLILDTGVVAGGVTRGVRGNMTNMAKLEGRGV